MAASEEGSAGPAAWLAYPLEAVYARLARAGLPVEIVCELVTGGRVEPGTEAGVRIVRVVRVERQEGMPACYQFLVDRSPESCSRPVPVALGESCCGKDVSRAR